MPIAFASVPPPPKKKNFVAAPLLAAVSVGDADPNSEDALHLGYEPDSRKRFVSGSVSPRSPSSQRQLNCDHSGPMTAAATAGNGHSACLAAICRV